ncbi:acyl-CoA dehydrogenase family protein [Endozoicomonadaceae bacterium StTr2]
MKRLAAILHDSVPEITNFAEWKRQWQQQEAGATGSTLEQAFYDGCRSDRVAWAFSAAYQWAIRSLIPNLESSRAIVALCITEQGGGHPRSIHSSLVRQEPHWVLSGQKQFVSGGTEADTLLIAANCGVQQDGRPQLKMLQLPAETAGLSIELMPALSVVPEVPHARVIMENVDVSDTAVLPGDGYDTYIRPFRLCEDLHVQAALLGMIARKGFDPQKFELVEQAVAFVHLLQGCQQQSDFSVASLAMSGVEPHLKALLKQTADLIVSDKEREAWQRDCQLLNIAGKARDQRRLKARAWLATEAG